jgi:hypothetical protein
MTRAVSLSELLRRDDIKADPPGVAPCQAPGTDPAAFDTTDVEQARDVLRRYCWRCPDPVRGWCFGRVQPERSHYDGVAAGALWVNGKRRPTRRTA